METQRTESPAVTARRLMRAQDRATLATSLEGWPYASLVLAAVDHDASPILLLSNLAEHSKNLARDRRASLLFDGTAGLDDPLTGARVTVVGQIEQIEDQRLLARFTSRHPAASGYATFADFHLYRVAVARAHLVAGFGRIHWVPADALLSAPAPALAQAEAQILEHMNKDHGEAVDLYARLTGAAGQGWRLTGIDPEGIDLRRGGTVERLDFHTPVSDAEDAREALVQLAQQAKTQG
jgi:heme iron utilization protein